MNRRVPLHEALVNAMVQSGMRQADALKRVYFQPPGNVTISYPCIVYSLSGDANHYGNDARYVHHDQYSVTAITKDPDSSLREHISRIPYCEFTNAFTSENLHHFVFTIYY